MGMQSVSRLHTHSRVMYEGSSLCIGWHVPRRGILEAFNNGRFTATIVSNNDGQGGVELDHMDFPIVKRSDASKGHLV